MNSPLAKGNPSSGLDPEERRIRPIRRIGEPEELGLVEWLANLWEGKVFIVVGLLLFVGLGGLYVWQAAPVYQVQALLQVQAKRSDPSNAAYGKMEGLLSLPSDTPSEVEILQSNLVLGRTVEALHLDLKARPKLFPIFGAALNRRDPEGPRIDVDSFDIPDDQRGLVFGLRALGNGAFQLESPKGAPLGQGEIGRVLSATYLGKPLTLMVRSLQAKPGQAFTLERSPVAAEVAALRNGLDVAEKGKLTNVLGLTLMSSEPALGTAVLNEIISQYIRQKVEGKNSTTMKTLDILREQLPQVKAKLDDSESRLNQFRARTGSVDVAREADTYLQQGANLRAQISSLQQKRQELLRTYREDSDVVGTLDKQIAQLQGESGRIESKVRTLPGAQQEVVRLSREVAVNTELYTALLNNIQQLRIASAGEVGGVTVVDPAQADPLPVAPRKTLLMGLFTFLGLLVGIGLAILRKALNPRIEDHRLIESKLGLPVLVTIPHSKAQEAHGQAIQNGEDGLHLLAALNPDDLATESLRSLRTSLHFSRKHAAARTIMVTGPSPNIGKSFVAGNLAAVLARSGSRVLVVDADLRKGTLHRHFWSKDRAGGLSDVLAGTAEWETVVHKTPVPRLSLMMSGSIPMNPSELLMTEAFDTFLAQASKAYDCVILDAPPVLAVTDALLIGAKVDGVLLVLKYGAHSLDELRACLTQLDRADLPVMGSVFNDVQPLGVVGNYTHYRYAYHYRYE